MIRVTYTVRNDNGFLVEKTHVVSNLSECLSFLVLIRASGNLVGKPIIS